MDCSRRLRVYIITEYTVKEVSLSVKKNKVVMISGGRNSLKKVWLNLYEIG